MASVNKVMLIGHLGKDPEVRNTQGGSSVCNMVLATDESFTDRDGNKRRAAEVVADNVYFGDSKRDSADGGYAPAPAYGAPVGRGYSTPAGGHSEFAEIGEEDGELPF